MTDPAWRLPYRDGEHYEWGQPWGYDPPDPATGHEGYGGNAQHFHYGVDLLVPSGTTIVAVADGTVVVADTEQPKGFPGVLDGAWGTVCTIRLADGLEVDYCHLSVLATYVGQQIRAGQNVGLSGATGIPGVTVFGAHLHLQLRRGKERLDPTARFPVE